MELKRSLVEEIQNIISASQARAIRSVDTERVLMYWQIGKVIFEEEQQGKSRADYGSFLIKSISHEFQPQFGSGFSIRQLEMNRQFYRLFSNTNALRSQFSWTHYRTLIRIENQDKRDFYIAEAAKNDAVVKITLPEENNTSHFNQLYPIFEPLYDCFYWGYSWPEHLERYRTSKSSRKYFRVFGRLFRLQRSHFRTQPNAKLPRNSGIQAQHPVPQERNSALWKSRLSLHALAHS